MANMRAKMVLQTVGKYPDPEEGQIPTQETLFFTAVSKSEAYDEDGLDEDNTYATFTPMAELRMTVTNPALIGTFEPGQTFYVDFTEIT